jgi:hypothetical protein
MHSSAACAEPTEALRQLVSIRMVKPGMVTVALAACVLSSCKGSTGPTPSTTTTTTTTTTPPSPLTLQSVTISNLPQTMYTPDTAQATSTARYSDNSTQNVTSSATWDSSNTVVATVANGLVTAKAGGLVDISATFQGMRASATVTVNLPSLKANPGGPYTANHGQSVTFSGLQSTSTPNPIAKYSWDCGQSVDPNTYTEHPPPCNPDNNPTPTFVYFKCGVPNRPACRQGSTDLRDYTVTLTITDTRGNTNTATTTVTVKNSY